MPTPQRADWYAAAAPEEFVRRRAPSIEIEAVDSCPVCSSSLFSRFAVGYDYELLTCRNPWRFVQCDDCAHVWLNPRPAITELSRIYPASYYAYSYETSINPIAVRAKEFLDRGRMRGILSSLGRRPTSFMDVGCGTGRFLKLMEKRGVKRSRNYGLELRPEVVKPLQDQGFQVFCERVENCSQVPGRSLDLVTMFHVIEHVDDPVSVVRSVAEWLAPSGIFAIETPNIDCFSARIFQSRFWGGYHFPRHWNLFMPGTLSRVCTDAGLKVVSIKFQPGHSFWMYSLHHWLRYRKKRPVAAVRLFDPFRGFLPFLAMFTLFDKICAGSRIPTGSLLLLAQQPT